MQKIKILHQCKKCNRYFTESKCDCNNKKFEFHKNEVSKDLCNFFIFPLDKFQSFLSNYFINIKDYSDLKIRNTDGTFYKIISSIFYFYSNMDIKVTIRKSELSGRLQQLGYYYGDFEKYLNHTYKLMASKYRRFSPWKMSREFKIKTNIKNILGRLKKPVFYKHVSSLVDQIGFDNVNINARSISASYIMFYIQHIRGIPLNYSNIAIASKLPIGTVSSIYHTQFMIAGQYWLDNNAKKSTNFESKNIMI